MIEESVTLDDCRPLLKFHNGDIELLKVTIGEDSPAVNKRIADLGFPRSAIVVALERKDGEVAIPNGDTRIAKGDEVLVMVKAAGRDQIRSALVGTTVASANGARS
jgi:Trk K+ transport system NAD-binding subunit